MNAYFIVWANGIQWLLLNTWFSLMSEYYRLKPLEWRKRRYSVWVNLGSWTMVDVVVVVEWVMIASADKSSEANDSFLNVDGCTDLNSSRQERQIIWKCFCFAVVIVFFISLHPTQSALLQTDSL